VYCPKCLQTKPGRFCAKCGVSLVAGDAPAAEATPVAPTGTLNAAVLRLGVCACGAGAEKITATGACGECHQSRIPECSVCAAAADQVNDDGVCTGCGFQRLPKPGDHDEVRIGPQCASVCDRGIKHAINQDWHGIAKVQSGSKTYWLLTICDGVSSSSASAAAAKAAVIAANERASFTLSRGMIPRDSIIEAAKASQKAVCSIQWTPQPMPDSRRDESPTCTFCMAIVCEDSAGFQVDYGWLGDSRLYWVTETNAGCLVKDHSWINQEIARGRNLDQVVAEAKREKLTRAIVRSLGSSETTSVNTLVPELGQFTLPKGAKLIACSDGLHVYADDPLTMARVVRKQFGSPAIAIAKSLVDYANQQGGCDNVSAAVLCS
jgi:serine/threonine protein phosphatase PrpC